MIDPELRKYYFQKLGYTPHSPKQLEIHESSARFKALACGRRYGKTTFGAMDLTVALLDPHHPAHYWIVGPKYTLGEKEFRVVYDNLFKKLGFANDKRFKKSYNVKQGDMIIEMPWGSLLEVKSAQHQETLLGDGLAGVIMAEAARHTTDTWEQYVRPALSDIGARGQRGWAIFTSTPRGYNWFQGLWMLGQVDEYGEYASWRLPSWENPIVYPGGRDDPEIAMIEKQVSANWFAQEIAAEFTAFAGKIYPEFDTTIHVRRVDYESRWTNVWFLDYGWANPFVCLDVMIDPEDNFYVWREYQVSERNTMEHADILLSRVNPEDYHVDWGAGDPRGPDQASIISTRTGVQIYSEDISGHAHESWKMGVEYVARMLQIREDGLPKLFVDPSCTDLIRQLEQLHAVDIKENKNAVEGQHKHDDHGPDALRYGIGQYLHSGAGSSLSDIYSPGRKRTEAQTFFQNNVNLARYGRF
jgi:hypothetical protein